MRTRHLLGLVVLMALALSGCYRSVGGSLEPTPSTREVAQVNTPLPQPLATLEGAAPTAEEMTDLPGPATLTPFPTLAPATDTPVPTATQTRVPPDGQGGLEQPTMTWTPVIVAMVPTNTSQPTSTATPQPTNTNPPPPTNTATLQPTNPPPATNTQPAAVAMVPSFTPPPSLTPLLQASLTFTPYPFNTLGPSATYTPFVPPGATLTASPTPPVGEAQPLGERPTDTLPAPAATQPIDQGGVAVAQVPTLNANQMSATAIIYGATLTQAALQGIVMPTFTPAPGQVINTPIPAGQVVIYITATPAMPGGICSQHLVQPNETLSRIAVQYGVTVNQVAQANAITNPDLIQMGATLSIPCPVPATPTPVGAVITPGTTGQGGLAGGNVYIVQAGDNIYRLSLQFGVTMLDLMNANGMTVAEAQMIYVGQQLVIPPSATVPAGVTPAPAQGTPIYIVITNTPVGVQPAPAG